MALEVHPLHKKQGAALEMIRYFEDYARRHGALLTLLLPFQISFYRRMGYGILRGSSTSTICPPRAAQARRRGPPPSAPLQPEDFDRVLACHSRFAAQNHGMVEKFERRFGPPARIFRCAAPLLRRPTGRAGLCGLSL